MPEPYTSAELDALGLSAAQIPRHVAIIMDGNGRWANRRGLPRVSGHQAGAERVRSIVDEAARLGVEQLTLYAFSSENWKRPRPELNFLFGLLQRFLRAEVDDMVRNGIEFATIGELEPLGEKICHEIAETKAKTAGGRRIRLCLALNYGGRSEIVRAVRSLACRVKQGSLAVDEIDEPLLEASLDTGGMPELDLMIRTSAEYRVSNFLLWQMSYAELYVAECGWPDFDEPQLHQALQSYAARDRRFGGLAEPAPRP